jgi:alpha-glucoside transport system substrate-binding protein
MNRMKRGAAPMLGVFALLFALGLAGCGHQPGGHTVVTVLGPWTGTERAGFLEMMRGFEQDTGIQVDYTGTRDADAVLASDLKNGSLPDLAVLATRGELSQLAASGSLEPLGGALDLKTMAGQYRPGWLRLMQATGPGGKRHYYAIIIKATLKSLIWYDPELFPASDLRLLTSPGLTWARLMSLTNSLRAAGKTPWCAGMADGSRSGWPGTDWIEDIVLHQSGPAVYDRWATGALPWTSAPIAAAWRTFGQIAATAGSVHGGPEAELATSYGVAGQPMFSNPPGCYLDHEGSFIAGFYPADLPSGPDYGRPAHPRPGADFRFVSFPALAGAGQGADEVSADLAGMFHDTPATRKLVAYLTTPQAQLAWISRPGSGALTVNRRVPLSAYPDGVSRALGRTLINATSIQFDASNSMPQTMENAFDNAVLQYLDSPGRLDVILRGLDQVRSAVYQRP